MEKSKSRISSINKASGKRADRTEIERSGVMFKKRSEIAERKQILSVAAKRSGRQQQRMDYQI